MIPAVWVDCDRSPLRVAPVAEHGAGSSVADLAFLASQDRLAGFVHDSHLDAVERRPAVRDDRHLRRVTEPASGGREDLGRSVEGQQAATAKDGGHLLGQAGGDRRPGADPGPHGGHIVLRRVESVERHPHKGSRGRRMRAAVLADPGQALLWLPDVLEVDGPARQDRGGHAHRESGAMTDRRRGEGNRAAIETKGLAQAANREPDRVPGMEATLGPRLGARREDQHMAVVRAWSRTDDRVIEIVIGAVRLGQVSEGDLLLARGAPDDDDVFQRGAGVPQLAEHLQVVEVPEHACGERNLGFGTLKDVADLVVAIDGHDRHQHRAGSDRGEVDDDEFVPVRKLGEDAVSVLHSHPAEFGRESVGLASRLAVGKATYVIGRELALGRVIGPTVEVVEEDLVSPPSFLSEPRRLVRGVPETDA